MPTKTEKPLNEAQMKALKRVGEGQVPIDTTGKKGISPRLAQSLIKRGLAEEHERELFTLGPGKVYGPFVMITAAGRNILAAHAESDVVKQGELLGELGNACVRIMAIQTMMGTHHPASLDVQRAVLHLTEALKKLGTAALRGLLTEKPAPSLASLPDPSTEGQV